MAISAVIVDDEPMVIESIRWGVDWAAQDITVSAVFTDSMEALNYIRENEVGIVITDINMPPFSGLVLCSRLLEYNSNIQLIIISGYADFSYAQKCIQYGALGYCLKPIDYDELTSCVKKAVKNLSSSSSAAAQEFIEALYENNTEILREYLDAEHFSETFYLAVSVSKMSVFHCYCQNIGLNEYLYISNEPISVTSDQIEITEIWGISSDPNPVSWDEMQQRVYQLIYNSYQFFFFPGKKDFIRNAVYDSQLLHKAKLLFACPDELECLLRDHGTVNHIRMAADLYNAVLQYLNEEIILYSYNQIVYRFKNFKELISYIKEELRKEAGVENDYESGNRKFLELIKFVNSNYSQDISAQMLAEKLDLNPCYISQLFKKETGTTFVRYMNELRINRAKELLLTTMMSINEISEACGFHDYFYFIKLFKKFTGKAPTRFRQDK